MLKILIIDDDRLFLENMCDFFTEEGFETIGAMGGLIGLKLALEEQPDIIICDALMPDLNGYEVLERLQLPTLAQKIIFIFLISDPNYDANRMQQLGAAGDFIKPISPRKLLEEIFSRLNQNNSAIE